ncbi:MAG: hypothetical protein CMG75_00180 [Candidatus Marinimicrobia bacterium]|nr:hypothetical protein [Candidatus Neomarinimicrobiota bacterium]|tara:strand:- start:168 stop:989 length:822 start_codon:yes stop_codon:yes gene_type:complete
MSIYTPFLNGQFKEARVSIDSQRLKENDRRSISTLENEVSNFFKLNQWDEEYSDLEIGINIQLIFEGVADKGSEHLFSAQCLVSVGKDQRYFSKGIQFPYNMGKSIVPSTAIFEPLSSALEFFAYLALAAEADTYDHFAGTRFYEKAREIALRGISSQYRLGWRDRMEMVDLLTKYRETRLAKFYFYDAMVLIEENNLEDADVALKEMLKNFEVTFSKYPREHYSIIFLTGHAEELSRMPDEIPSKLRVLKRLSELDPDNKAKYQLGLGNKSR